MQNSRKEVKKMIRNSRGKYNRLLAVILSAALVFGNTSISNTAYAEEPAQTTQNNLPTEQIFGGGASLDEISSTEEISTSEETFSSVEETLSELLRRPCLNL